MIIIENLTKSFGTQLLFDNINFTVGSRERVGLVGRNGHGKTSLFRIITGEDHADSGNVIIPRHYTVGYVKQQLDFTEDSVLKEAMLGLPAEERDHYWKAEKILAGLGFSGDDFERKPSEFSGGYQVRLNLAKVLISEPNMLLLDEPTNYLDIMSIRWIERFLLSWPGELMLISHDRSFMDKLVTHIVGIHRKKTRKISGNTEKFYNQIAKDEEIYEKTRLNDEKKRKEVELFITRFRAKARLAGMVQSRVKKLEKEEKKDKLDNIKSLDFSFQSAPFSAKQVLSADNISFSYNKDSELIRDFSITIGSRDRICIIGKNGKGKTTLLKLLAGILDPDSGRLIANPNIKTGLYEQTNVQSLVDKRTVEEEILNSCPGVERQQARNISGAMMFEGDDALKKIEVLSGGEKSRVMLGKLLVTPINLLLLDEPTNHLDMESSDALLAAIDDFDGAVVIVTHNEMFLHALAERLVVFQKEISVYEGSYQGFLEDQGWEDELDPGERSVEDTSRTNRKDQRRMRSELIQERSKVLNPLQKKISATEKSIEKNETELNSLNEAMIEASHKQDGRKIAELSQSIFSCRESIDLLFEELEKLTEEFEKKDKYYNERLAEIDGGSV